MSQATTAQYIISLCNIAQQHESFGVAVRIGSSDSRFNVAAKKTIHSVLTFSPALDTMAMEYLNELAKIPNLSYLGKFLYIHIGFHCTKLDSSTGLASCFSI